MWSCLSKYMKSILKMKAVTYIHPPVILNGLERCWPHGSEGLTQWAVVELKSQSVKSTLGLPAPLRCCRVCTFIYPDPRTRLSWYRLCWYMVTGSKKKDLPFRFFLQLHQICLFLSHLGRWYWCIQTHYPCMEQDRIYSMPTSATVFKKFLQPQTSLAPLGAAQGIERPGLQVTRWGFWP